MIQVSGQNYAIFEAWYRHVSLTVHKHYVETYFDYH